MISKLIRRTHMYLALFLAPWMLIYSLSTMAMNHRGYLRERYGGPVVKYEKEREQVYAGVFPPEAKPREMADQIVRDLGIDGTHGVSGPGPEGRITIFRQDPITPRRIVYSPREGRLIIEREVFRTPAFLERMHRRRGFQHPYALENAWAISVDLVIVAMVFWVASGLWMWWEMRVTRWWGAIFAAAGAGLFLLFLFTI